MSKLGRKFGLSGWQEESYPQKALKKRGKDVDKLWKIFLMKCEEKMLKNKKRAARVR